MNIFNEIEDRKIRKYAKRCVTGRSWFGRGLEQITSVNINLSRLLFKKSVEITPISETSCTVVYVLEQTDSIPPVDYGTKCNTIYRVNFVNSCEQKAYINYGIDRPCLFAEYEISGKLSIFNEIRNRKIRKGIKKCVTEKMDIVMDTKKPESVYYINEHLIGEEDFVFENAYKNHFVKMEDEWCQKRWYGRNWWWVTPVFVITYPIPPYIPSIHDKYKELSLEGPECIDIPPPPVDPTGPGNNH